MFYVRYTLGFVFSNKYDTNKKHPWGGKGRIILKLQNDINIPDENNSSIICGYEGGVFSKVGWGQI